MTTAPTPSRAEELAQWLEQDWDAMGVPELLDVAKELGRLQADNERLLAQVHKLEMEALDLASENSILKRAEESELEARKPLPLSDEQIDDLHGEANRGFDIGREEYFKAFRDAERAHGITGGSS